MDDVNEAVRLILRSGDIHKPEEMDEEGQVPPQLYLVITLTAYTSKLPQKPFGEA